MFDPSRYGPAAAALLAPRVPALGPGTPNAAVRDSLAQLVIAPECRAGLWLYHDYLDESHVVSQDLHTAEGSFWHAIMHRREPDAANSKYWWRQVGAHPVLEQLVRESPALGYAYTTPAAFVDYCERVRGSGLPDEDLAKRVQLLEWQLLFDWCFRKATA
jgi:hypothetical protein